MTSSDFYKGLSYILLARIIRRHQPFVIWWVMFILFKAKVFLCDIVFQSGRICVNICISVVFCVNYIHFCHESNKLLLIFHLRNGVKNRRSSFYFMESQKLVKLWKQAALVTQYLNKRYLKFKYKKRYCILV